MPFVLLLLLMAAPVVSFVWVLRDPFYRAPLVMGLLLPLNAGVMYLLPAERASFEDCSSFGGKNVLAAMSCHTDALTAELHSLWLPMLLAGFVFMVIAQTVAAHRRRFARA